MAERQGSRLTLSAAFDWVEPARLFPALFPADENAVWLEAGVGDAAGQTWFGTASASSWAVTARALERQVRVSRPDGGAAFERPGGILETLRGLAGPPSTAAGDVHLGWAGWLGYEVGAVLTGAPVAETRGPDAALLLVDRAVVFDHNTRVVTAVAGERASPDAWFAAVAAAVEASRGGGGRAAPAASAAPEPIHPAQNTGVSRPVSSVRWRHDDAAYVGLIAQCQEAIRRGDAYQLCLTNQAHVAGRFDPLEVWNALRRTSPTGSGALIRIDGISLVSASPERFLTVSASGHVSTRPIKGTRPRGGTAERDAQLRSELLASAKERAENIMIVDLMRNDLSRVCEPGSVTVTQALDVETYAQVHQLVSTIEGQLAAGADAYDAVAACLPAASMTGAPRLAAMRLLHELERGSRGAYAGCFGRFGLDGSAALGVVIRTIVLEEGGASVGTGGGITALSVPDEEVREMQLKAEALLAVLESASHLPNG
ncbi:anthranilate synthase component I family protein [Microbacterium sp. STN6]|uniref:anthranilate synthase component I family protein n=1 Tax=Microbacterium sp. STN6 TaxID=2995588 RepID=UPI002260DA2B|nr:anthranilate synthase component I family protein [Microbacterium sp. STN6]MCX7522289.1 anthranilate synthase component I family protein [Microbacterium sp. STN6]